VKIMSENVKNMLDEKVSEFNSKVNDDPNFSKKIEGKNRTITISVSDGDNYGSKLEDLKLDDFNITEDINTDLVVTASAEVLEGLMTKTMSPIKAYMSGSLKVKASFSDILLLKKLF